VAVFAHVYVSASQPCCSVQDTFAAMGSVDESMAAVFERMPTFFVQCPWPKTGFHPSQVCVCVWLGVRVWLCACVCIRVEKTYKPYTVCGECCLFSSFTIIWSYTLTVSEECYCLFSITFYMVIHTLTVCEERFSLFIWSCTPSQCVRNVAICFK